MAPELIPRLLVGLLDGLAMQHYVEPGAISPEDLEKSVEAIAGALFEMAPIEAR